VTRGGRQKPKDEPERRCIATGESAGASGLIRFVVGPDGTIVPDISARLPGRGIWVTSSRAALDRAVGRNLFSRAARRKVAVPEGFVDQVEALVARRLVDLVALTRKAGLAVSGNDKVRTRLKKGPVAALVEASDGSEQGKAKLRPLAQQAPRIGCLTASELGLAFGRDHVIHAALDAGGISDRVLVEAGRLAGLRNIMADAVDDRVGAGRQDGRPDR
jgi:predicted RNA-binding protein YlxR (DUF448 family)